MHKYVIEAFTPVKGLNDETIKANKVKLSIIAQDEEKALEKAKKIAHSRTEYNVIEIEELGRGGREVL